MKFIAGVISAVICCLLFRLFLQESGKDGDPLAASPSSVFEKGNFLFPCDFINYYRIFSITSSLGFMIIAGM